jgi:hypothetical protein
LRQGRKKAKRNQKHLKAAIYGTDANGVVTIIEKGTDKKEMDEALSRLKAPKDLMSVNTAEG